jgi:hypothetical protein
MMAAEESDPKREKPSWPPFVIWIVVMLTAVYWVTPATYLLLRSLYFGPSLFLICICEVVLAFYTLWAMGRALVILGRNYVKRFRAIGEVMRSRRLSAELREEMRAQMTMPLIPREFGLSLTALFLMLPFTVSLLLWHDMQKPSTRRVNGVVVAQSPRDQLQETLARIEKKGIFRMLPLDTDER